MRVSVIGERGEERTRMLASLFVLSSHLMICERKRIEIIFLACSAFTTLPDADIVSPGLVEDGIMCGTGSLCLEQRCVTISSLGLPQCPTGSNGRVCSGNGVSARW